MRTRRIHIMGASGAGVTTLGRAVGDRFGSPHHDTDDYYWMPTNPPYRIKRERDERLRLMREMFLSRSDWVLSGSLDDWGKPIIPLIDSVVFVRVPTDIRLQRLRARETRRYGAEATGPDGWHQQETGDFIEWAAHYDDGTREGRHLARHLAWLETLSCPVLRLDGTKPTAALADDVVAFVTKFEAGRSPA